MSDDLLDDIAQEIHARGGSAEIINAVHACREGHPLNTGTPFANLRFMLAGRGLVTGEQSIWIARQAQKESIWIARQAQKEIAGRG